MADGIGVASGVMAVASFALISSITLHETIKRCQFHQQHVRTLSEELEALSAILRLLTETVGPVLDEQYPVLKLPLLRCGKACQEFQEEIINVSSVLHNRTNIDEDVDGLRRLLTGYRMAINVALIDARLSLTSRNSVTTTGNIHAYQNLIATAQGALEKHLERIGEECHTIRVGRAGDDTTDTLELRAINEERLSTEKCLRVCAQLLSRIEEIQRNAQNERADDPNYAEDASERTIGNDLGECKVSTSSVVRSTKLAPAPQALKLWPNRPVMSIIHPISPPESGGSDPHSYKCYAESDNRPWEVFWSGSQQYPDFSEVVFRHLNLSEQASAAWSSSSLLAYGSYAVVRAYDQGGKYPVAKIAHPNPTARRLLQHEYETVQALAGISIIAKVDPRPLIDNEGIFGFRMEQLWKLDFDHLETVRDEVQAILGAMHDFGYCHGDLSPSNVMTNESGQLVLIDLSFAGVIGQRLPPYIPGWVYDSEVFDKSVDDERLERYFSKHETQSPANL